MTKMQLTYRDAAIPENQRVSELHVWVAIQPNGAEGIVSADFDIDGMKQRMPMLSSMREVAEKMTGIARKMERQSFEETGVAVKLRLVTFRQVYDA